MVEQSRRPVSKQVPYDEFQQYVRDGYVNKVVGYDDSSVEVYIKPQFEAKYSNKIRIVLERTDDCNRSTNPGKSRKLH